MALKRLAFTGKTRVNKPLAYLLMPLWYLQGKLGFEPLFIRRVIKVEVSI